MKKDLESGGKKVEGMASQSSSNMKYWSLVILIFQNASLILTIRYSRTLSGDMYVFWPFVYFGSNVAWNCSVCSIDSNNNFIVSTLSTTSMIG